MGTENKSRRLRLLLAAGLALLVLITAGCGLSPTTAPRASDRWSNGKLLGTAVLNNQLGFQVDEWGTSFVVWIDQEHKLSFARLDDRSETVSQGPLDLRTSSPLRPQLLMDSTGQFHLTWLDKEERGLQLFYARLSADGEVLQEATVLSPADARAALSSMVLDPVGRTVELFWSDNTPSRPGCYHTALDWSGVVLVPPELLIAEGIWPAAQVDNLGYVHLAWRVEPEPEMPEFHYAVYDPRSRALGPDTIASEPLLQIGLLGRPTAGASFDGPWLGLDQDSAYLAWVVEVREMRDVMNFTFYQAFPQPALSRRDAAETFDYQPPTVVAQPVHVQGVEPNMTGHPQFLDGQPAQQVLACFTQVSGPRSLETLQIVAVDVGPELVTGQELVSASRGASLQPSLAADDRGNLHLAWIDTAGFRRYQVVYASNSPQVKGTLNRITAYDVVDRVLGTVMNIFAAFFLVPIVLSWVFLPLGYLAVFSMVTGAVGVSEHRGRRALGLAMLLHTAVKILFFGDLLSRFPLSPLLSPSQGLVLGRWIAPVLLAGLSALAAWLYLRRTRSQSVFVPYLIFAAIDSFVTLIVYVALPMGQF